MPAAASPALWKFPPRSLAASPGGLAGAKGYRGRNPILLPLNHESRLIKNGRNHLLVPSNPNA
jgi:hypothetical protein